MARNATRTNGNATIARVGNTVVRPGAGMPVEWTGIGAGCTIASVTDNSIRHDSSACVTSSGTSTVTVFLTGYGASGTTSTIGAPDYKGRALAGRDPESAPANRLTSSYFGADSAIMNKPGGFESQTLTLAQLPTGITSANLAAINLSVTSNRSVSDPTGSAIAGGTIGGVGTTNSALVSTGTIAIGAAAVTSNNTSGAAHPIVPPTLIAECVVRVVP